MEKKKKLIIVAGSDRTGKSSMIAELQGYLGEENCSVYHHGAPDRYTESIFDFYRFHIEEWVASKKEWCIFDRSWVCSYCLEDFRRHNNGQLDAIADLEIELIKCEDAFSTVHLGIKRPWNWSARHHVIELKEMFPDAPDWFIRDHYVSRKKEHRVYYDRLAEFYEHITAFPHVWTFGSDDLETITNNLIEAIDIALGLKPGPVQNHKDDALLAEFVRESVIKNLYS